MKVHNENRIISFNNNYYHKRQSQISKFHECFGMFITTRNDRNSDKQKNKVATDSSNMGPNFREINQS